MSLPSSAVDVGAKLSKHPVCTLVCLINVLGQISVLGGQFSEINKRPGPNKHPGRTFSEIYNYSSTYSDLKILEFSKKIL